MPLIYITCFEKVCLSASFSIKPQELQAYDFLQGLLVPEEEQRDQRGAGEGVAGSAGAEGGAAGSAGAGGTAEGSAGAGEGVAGAGGGADAASAETVLS